MNIEKTLEQAPGMISRLAMEDPDRKVDHIKALVNEREDLYRLRLDLLTLESAWKKAVIEMDKWVTAYTSARKLANLKIEEMRNINPTVGGKK